MTRLYVITKYLTLPAVIIRCMWEQIICKAAKVFVEDTQYIRKDELCGHIEHEIIKSRFVSWLVAVVPFISAVLGVAFYSVFPYIFRASSLSGRCFSLISVWLVISFAANCFPSVEAVLNIGDKLYKQSGIAAKIILSPLFALLYAGAYLERYCITFIAALVGSVFVFLL